MLLVVALLVGVLIGPGDEAERVQRGRLDLAFGGLAALASGIAATWPRRRMPDWAIGLREGGELAPPLRAPVVALGWVLAGLAALAALVAAGIWAAVGALAIAIVAPLALARSLHRFLERAARTREWASARGLRWRPELEVPERTPLLRDGDHRYALNAVEGEIGQGITAAMFHLACVTIDKSHDGHSERTDRYTALVASVPDPGKRLPLCICAPRARIPGTDAYDAWRQKLNRIDLESSEFERRFELAIDRKADEAWMRRLFEPTFLERMILLSSARLGWELEGGALTVYEQGYVSEAAELDRLAELAGLVADRVRREVEETTALRS